MKNESTCMCCGQKRPYPKEPGRWEFCNYPCVVDREDPVNWTQVTVEKVEEGLQITPDGETEPIWWPSSAEWRQIK